MPTMDDSPGGRFGPESSLARRARPVGSLPSGLRPGRSAELGSWRPAWWGLGSWRPAWWGLGSWRPAWWGLGSWCPAWWGLGSWRPAWWGLGSWCPAWWGPASRIVGCAIAAVLLASCSAGGTSPQSRSVRTGGHQSRGLGVNVAFAGSLLAVNNEVVGPAFEKATGYSYTGRGGGSIGLAHEIETGEIAPDVFESVGSAPIKALEPRFTSWYVQLFASPLVIAYNPSSPYAATFEEVAAGKKPLSSVFGAMASPGFRLGRTNPATDPQGQAFVMMTELAERTLHLPGSTLERIVGNGVLHGGIGNESQIFSETSLDAHLEAGQLDAASAFLSQAIELHLHYVRLPSSIDFGDPAYADLYATASLVVPGSTPGTLATIHGTPLVVDGTTITRPGETPAQKSAAAAFVSYLASPAGRRAYTKEGFELLPEKLYGDAAAAPASIRMAALSRG